MAIFHLTASVLSRSRGQRVIAAAAARAGVKLYDRYYGVTHDFSRHDGVVHREILAPSGSPHWAYDREALWNRVEAREGRKDSQLARAVEVALPAELSNAASLLLVRDFVHAEFVSNGMVADVAIRLTNPRNPLAQILLTLRRLDAEGFGCKAREWNKKTNLLEWRSAWAEHANHHLARAGHCVRVDHRTLEAQHIELTPERRIGLGMGPVADRRLPDHLASRVSDQNAIAAANGAALIADPALTLRAITRRQPIFSAADLAQFLRPRTVDELQFQSALTAVLNCPDLRPLPTSDAAAARFTSRDLVEAERSLRKRAATMAQRRGAATADGAFRAQALRFDADSAAWQDFRSACAAWLQAGCVLSGVGTSRAMRQRLQDDCGVPASTTEQFERRVAADPGLGSRDLVIVFGAEMIDLKTLERMLAAVDKARAALVLVGDVAQLEAMGASSPLSMLLTL